MKYPYIKQLYDLLGLEMSDDFEYEDTEDFEDILQNLTIQGYPIEIIKDWDPMAEYYNIWISLRNEDETKLYHDTTFCGNYNEQYEIYDEFLKLYFPLLKIKN